MPSRIWSEACSLAGERRGSDTLGGEKLWLGGTPSVKQSFSLKMPLGTGLDSTFFSRICSQAVFEEEFGSGPGDSVSRRHFIESEELSDTAAGVKSGGSDRIGPAVVAVHCRSGLRVSRGRSGRWIRAGLALLCPIVRISSPILLFLPMTERLDNNCNPNPNPASKVGSCLRRFRPIRSVRHEMKPIVDPVARSVAGGPPICKLGSKSFPTGRVFH
jgi:hypothetical protein